MTVVDARKVEILDAMEKMFIKLNAVSKAAFCTDDMRKVVFNIVDLIGALQKNIGRMKPETYEKRYQKIVSELESIMEVYAAKRAMEKEAEYAELVEPVEVSKKKEPKKEGQAVLTDQGDVELVEQSQTEDQPVDRSHKLSIQGGDIPERKDPRGRKRIGDKRKIGVTLEIEQWQEIDKMLLRGEIKSYAEFFRWATNTLLGSQNNEEEVS